MRYGGEAAVLSASGGLFGIDFQVFQEYNDVANKCSYADQGENKTFLEEEK